MKIFLIGLLRPRHAWRRRLLRQPEVARQSPFLENGGGPAQDRQSARPTTAIVSPRNISFAITAAGEITPAEHVSVRPEISGRIEELPVDIGDEVKKDATPFHAR